MHTTITNLIMKDAKKKRAIGTIKSGEFSVTIHIKQKENEREVLIKKKNLRLNDFDCLKYGLHNLNYTIMRDYSSVKTNMTM